MNKDQKKGLLLLVLFWSVSFFLPKWDVKTPEEFSISLAPLTIPEKILFGFPLSLNQLTAEEWELLPHIGPAVAQKIVSQRDQMGGFKNLDDLLEVKGIGPKTLRALGPFFTPKASAF